MNDVHENELRAGVVATADALAAIGNLSHSGLSESTELYHHGVKGMKWGVRKARNEVKTIRKMALRTHDDNVRKQLNDSADKRSAEADAMERELAIAQRNKRIKQGVAAVGIALAAVGAYKIHQKGEAQRMADALKRKTERKNAKEQSWLRKHEAKLANMQAKRDKNNEVWGSVGDDRWNSFGSAFSKKASRGASIVKNLLSAKSSAGPIKLDNDTEFYQ